MVTAAHCTAKSSPQSLYVAAGSIDITLGDNYQVSDVFNHPQFNLNTVRNDIALLKTEDGIKFNSFVQPLPIASAYIGEGESAVASGWGLTSNPGVIPTTLQFLVVKSISNKNCLRQHSALNAAMIYEASICTLTRKNEGLCMGDSGGPLVQDGKLIGIVSWGIPCAKGKPDVFTRVSVFAEWIQNIITTRSQ